MRIVDLDEEARRAARIEDMSRLAFVLAACGLLLVAAFAIFMLRVNYGG